MSDRDPEIQAELTRLRNQVDELQRRGTELVSENRVHKAELAAWETVGWPDRSAPPGRPDVRRPNVLAFFAIAGQMPGGKPHVVSDQEIRFRAELNVEEMFEIVEACFDPVNFKSGVNPLSKDPPPELAKMMAELDEVMEGENPTPANMMQLVKGMAIAFIRHVWQPKVDLPKLVDGLADTDYVTEGFRVALGVDGYPVWAGVHAANMAKKDGPKDPETGKHGKPPGWQAFDVGAELTRQGWSG